MIDFARVLKDFDDTPIGEAAAAGAAPVPLTLGRAVCNALLAVYQDEPNLAGEDKVKRYALALKINGASAADPPPTFSVVEIALAKRLTGKLYGPLIVGQAWPLLDPATAA